MMQKYQILNLEYKNIVDKNIKSKNVVDKSAISGFINNVDLDKKTINISKKS